MTSPRPHFTTVICNYDYADFVADAVNSVLEQDYPADRRNVIVVDDGSTDDSRAVLAQFAARDDVTVIEQANTGQAGALARGIELAQGDFVCLLDSDDLFRPDKFARVEAHLARPECSGRAEDSLVLFHDYAISEQGARTAIVPSWFERNAHRTSEARIEEPTDDVHLPIPCGQIYSRALIQRVARALPSADFRYGADVAIGHAAFLLAGRIDYLHAVLATYRIHGRNNFGGSDGEAWAPKRTTWHRWPRYLWFFEALMATFEGSVEARIARLSYIKRLERDRQSVSFNLGLAKERLAFVIDASGSAWDAISATHGAVAGQDRTDVEVTVVDAPQTTPPRHDGRTLASAKGSDAMARMAIGYRAVRAEFVTFLTAGDRPDPTFAERLTHILQYEVPALFACCDYRVVSRENTLLHSGVMLRSGAWETRHVAVAPFSSYLSATVFPPLGAAVMRRTRFLDHFFGPVEDGASSVPDAIAGWTLFLYLQALSRVRRLPQILFTRNVGDAIEIPVHPTPGSETQQGHCIAAARYLLTVYCTARPEFQRHYAPEWHARFIAWLVHDQQPEAIGGLRAIAVDHDDSDSVDLIDAVVELRETQA